MAHSVDIKGIRDGLLVRLDEPYAAWRQALVTELTAKQAFLKGSRIALAAGSQPLPQREIAALRDLFAAHDLKLWAVLAEQEETKAAARALGLATRLPGSHTDLEGNALTPEPLPVPQPAEPTHNQEPSGPLLLKETLRSGRSVYHEGAVVIVGDVNPGAEVIAAGDVIVWGRLRGMVHAGALGDATAVICALELTPTQLRIADQIAIPPRERPSRSVPEQAAIQAGQIVAQPWQARS